MFKYKELNETVLLQVYIGMSCVNINECGGDGGEASVP